LRKVGRKIWLTAYCQWRVILNHGAQKFDP
jgi:hypothetical protein